MLTIQITQSGKCVRIDVEQMEFVRVCPYCQVEFTTIEPGKIWCKTSHGVMASRIRNFSANLPAAMSTIGLRLRLRPTLTYV